MPSDFGTNVVLPLSKSELIPHRLLRFLYQLETRLLSGVHTIGF